MRALSAFVVLIGISLAQVPPTGPVVSPRGVVNAFTQQPAPSVVAAGGIIHITGLNLGPPAGAKATGTPLPTQLGDPPVEVLIDGKPVPLFSASPERIVAQVPFETDPGLAQVVVRRGGAESRSARIVVSALLPSVRTAGDTGYGEVAGTLSGRILTVPVSGLGPSQPRVESGEAGPADPPARPRVALEAYIGGLPANLNAALSKDRVGEFDVNIQVPVGSQPGDVVTLLARTRTAVQAANRATFQRLTNAHVQFIPLPDGAPEFHNLLTSDLNGNYLIATAARDDSGCYPAYLFDVVNKKASKIDSCLTAANRNAQTPVIAARDGSALAALVGPPEGEAPAGVSSKVQIFNPGKDSIVVDLGASASNLVAGAGGDFQAVIPGTPPHVALIDALTGEVTEAAGAAGGGQPAAVPVPKIDLGDGLTQVLFVLSPAQGVLAVIVADDADQPKRAKVALLNAKGEVQGSKDFPDGWVPLIAPRAPEIPGAQPGGAALPAAAVAALRRIIVSFDAEARTLYVLAKAPDNSKHGLVAFALDSSPAKLIPFPETWFAAACSPSIPFFNLELSRKLAFLGSNVAETQVKDPCPGLGFVLFDLDKQTTGAVALPGQGQYDADPAASGDVNDFIYGTNTDPSRRNTADTLYVLDSVTASTFRMDLPPGITSFANLNPVPLMNALIGLAMNRAAGDAGFVFFDLDRAEAKVLPTPEGFSQVNLMGIFPTTRKLVARGTRTGGAGFQYLIYDLVSGDLLMPPNPEGVASVGAAPPRAGQPAAPGGAAPGGTPAPATVPAVLQRANPKANSVAAVAFDSRGRQVGVMALRVP